MRTASRLTPVSRSRTAFDPDSGLPAAVSEWRSDDPGDVARADFEYDSATGNLTGIRKPEQRADNMWSSLEYDANALFIATSTNELGHSTGSEYDLGTGELIRRWGPNAMTRETGAGPVEVFSEEVRKVDGFGRLRARSVSFDDDAEQYRLVPIERLTILDPVAANAGTSHTVLREVRRGQTEDAWIRSKIEFDGLGRTLRISDLLDDGSEASTTYTYDALGHLAAIEVPDPSATGFATVRYEYLHDAIGRLTQFVRPEDPASGLSIAYRGLDKIVEETTADDTGAMRTEVYDALGNLREVHEFGDAGPPAITSYRYDANDRLARVVNADGNAKMIQYDWIGNRVSFSSAGRTWQRQFDLNGNLLDEVSPAPAGADAADYTLSYSYDALDRLKTLRFAALRDSKDVLGLLHPDAEFGFDPPDRQGDMSQISYIYDTGTNAIGRLSRVNLPFAEIAYFYDARGLTIREELSLTFPDANGFSAGQSVERSYNVLGQLLESTWDDGRQWRRTYDGRGLVSSVDLPRRPRQTGAAWRATTVIRRGCR